MNRESARNWIRKAENDLKIGKDEMKTDNPATDAVCFHMQQCVEKYLKSYLIFNSKEFRRTHDIAELIDYCSEINPEFQELYKMNADKLTKYSVEIRYAEELYFPSIEEAEEAIKIAEQVKDFVLKKLKAEGFEP
jgi:HEPN domain-containing protein